MDQFLAIAALPLAAVPYTPDIFAADLIGGAAAILPYVGAGVAGGLALMFAFMGIRKGIAFFRGTSK